MCCSTAYALQAHLPGSSAVRGAIWGVVLWLIAQTMLAGVYTAEPAGRGQSLAPDLLALAQRFGCRRVSWRICQGKGLSFGAGFFLLMDAFMNPAFGFTPWPGAFPWQAHARGLGGHLAFGFTSEALMADLDRVARARS